MVVVDAREENQAGARIEPMFCPRCDNEVSQEEAFCGQCGAPNPSRVSANPTARVNTPAQSPPHTFHTGTQLSPGTHYTNIPYPADGAQPSRRTPAPNPQTGFHQSATEAMSALPASMGQGFATGHPQQHFPNASMYNGYSATGQGVPHMPPLQAGHYTGSMPSAQHPFIGTGHNYVMPRSITPPTKQSGSTVVLIACICLAIVLISGTGVAFLITRSKPAPSSSAPTAAISPVTTQATTPGATSTVAPTPTTESSPTPSPTVGLTPSPSPAVSPTVVADAGFTWCADLCAAYGFVTEYPSGWQSGPSSSAAGVQFTNPVQADQLASFKAPGPTSSPAGDILNNNLQTNYASRPGYVPPSATSTTTISGATWVTATAYYQNDIQKERVIVFATVQQGKAYIIELQAPDPQFDTVNSQFFNSMLIRYQFLQPAT